VAPTRTEIAAGLHDDVRTLWEYNQLHHELRSCSVGIGLGSHDVAVAQFSAELFHRGLFPLLVFTGAGSPTTRDRFPAGEAVHYREAALRLGVPAEAILLEPHAANTAENIQFSRRLLSDRKVEIDSVLLISRPYQQRRAFATCRKIWPEVDVICASEPSALPDYVARIGDAGLVVNMLVGDTQRIIEYPTLGYTIGQEVPAPVVAAYLRLVQAGYTRRLI
jgi:uncharacterized SAM-binding protein YcdF (DUF218 family)